MSFTLRPAKLEPVPLSSRMLSPNSIWVELTYVVVPDTVKLPLTVTSVPFKINAVSKSDCDKIRLVTSVPWLEIVVAKEADTLSKSVSNKL